MPTGRGGWTLIVTPVARPQVITILADPTRSTTMAQPADTHPVRYEFVVEGDMTDRTKAAFPNLAVARTP